MSIEEIAGGTGEIAAMNGVAAELEGIATGVGLGTSSVGFSASASPATQAYVQNVLPGELAMVNREADAYVAAARQGAIGHMPSEHIDRNGGEIYGKQTAALMNAPKAERGGFNLGA